MNNCSYKRRKEVTVKNHNRNSVGQLSSGSSTMPSSSIGLFIAAKEGKYGIQKVGEQNRRVQSVGQEWFPAAQRGARITFDPWH